MNKESVYYKIEIKNNDVYAIKNVYLQITDIVDYFDYNFNLMYTNGNGVKYSYVANNYECYKYLNTINEPITFPIGNAVSWFSLNDFNYPDYICISLIEAIQPNESFIMLAYTSDTDNSKDGKDIFEFYDDFNDDKTFLNNFHVYDNMIYEQNVGGILIHPQSITQSGKLLTSQRTFSYDSIDVFQIMARWRVKSQYTTDSSYIGLIKTRTGLKFESSKYVYSTRSNECRVQNVKIDNGYTNTGWNYGLYTFRPAQFRMYDEFYGSKTVSVSYTNFDDYYLCFQHSNPNVNSINNNIRYDFIAKTAFPLIAPTCTISRKTKFYETYTSNIKTTISEPEIDLSKVDNFECVTIDSEEYNNAYIRFAYSFDDKETWVIYNTETGVWEEVGIEDIIIENSNLFDSNNSKGMTPELVANLTSTEFDKAIAVFGTSKFYIMACYKSDLQTMAVVRDIYENDIPSLYSEGFTINSDFKKISLAYKCLININNSSNNIDYDNYQFRVNISNYLLNNSENIRIVDGETFENIPFTYEYTDGVCHSSDSLALPYQSKTGYIWIKTSVDHNSIKQLYILNNDINKATEGYDIFDRYCDFTRGVTDFFTLDADINLDITINGTTLYNRKGMYGKFDDILDDSEYIVEVTSAITKNYVTNVSGSRIMISSLSAVAETGTSTNFVANVYSSIIGSYGTNDYLVFTNTGVIQSGISFDVFEKYGMVLRKDLNSLKIYKNNDLYKSLTIGNYNVGVDMIRLGYMNRLSEKESTITPTIYKLFIIRKYNDILPNISTIYEYDDMGLVKTNDSTNFKFNNDFFKSITSIKCHENKPLNTNIRYLFSFDNANTWYKWSTDEQLYTNGWKYRYGLTIDKNRVPYELTDFKLPIKLDISSGTGGQNVTGIFDHLRNGEYYSFFDTCTGNLNTKWDLNYSGDCSATYSDSKLNLSVNDNLLHGINTSTIETYPTEGETTIIFDWNPASSYSFINDEGVSAFGLISFIPTSNVSYTDTGNIPNFDADNKAFLGVSLKSDISKLITIHARINGDDGTDFTTSWGFPSDNDSSATYRVKLCVNWDKFTIKLYINNKQLNNIMNFNPIIKTIIGEEFKVNFHWHCNYRSGIQKFSNILIYKNNGESPLGLRYFNDNKYKLYATTSGGVNCPIEIVSFDCHNRTALILATVPHIAKTDDTIIYLYYDKYHRDNSTISLNPSYVFDGYEYIKNYQLSTNSEVIKRWAEIPIDSISTLGNIGDEISNNPDIPYRSMMEHNIIDVAICLTTTDSTKTPSLNGLDINCVYDKIENVAKIHNVNVFYENQYGEYTPDISTDIRFYKIDTADFAGFYRIKNLIGKIIFNY